MRAPRLLFLAVAACCALAAFALGSGAAGPATPAALADHGVCTWPEAHGDPPITCVQACVFRRSDSFDPAVFGVASRRRAEYTCGGHGADDFWTWCLQQQPICTQGGGPPAAPTLTVKPAEQHSSSTARFEWTHGDGAVGFECQLSSDPVWRGCSSGQEYKDLEVGDYTFKLRATKGGLTSPEVAHEFRFTQACALIDEPKRRALPGEATRSPLLEFGSLIAKGCFSKIAGPGGQWKASSPVTIVNGLTIVREAAELRFYADSDGWNVRSIGNVRVKLGGFTLWYGPIHYREKNPAGNTIAQVSKDFPTAGLTPSAKLDFGNGSTKLTFALVVKETRDLSLKTSKWYSPEVGGFSSELVLQSTNDNPSLNFESLKFQIDEMVVAKTFKIQNASFSYVASKKEFAVRATVVLPTKSSPSVTAGLAWNGGGLSGVDGELDVGKPGFPIYAGVFLQRIRLRIALSDDGTSVTVGGGLGLAGGPVLPIGGNPESAVSVDGDLSYTFAAAGNPGVFRVSSPESGGVKVFGYNLAGGWATLTTTGKLDFDGIASFNLADTPMPDKPAAGGDAAGGGAPGAGAPGTGGDGGADTGVVKRATPKKKKKPARAAQAAKLPAYFAQAHLRGWAESTIGFNASGAVRAKLPGLGNVSGNAVASTKGLIACFGKPGKRVGFSYSWVNRAFEGYGLPGTPVCDVSPWYQPRVPPTPAAPRRTPGLKPVQLSARAAASTKTKRLFVPASQSIAQFEFAGVGGRAPRVTLTGPGGRRLAVRADGEGRSSAGFGFANDASGITTITLLDPPSGVWTARSDIALKRTRQADELPLPALSATVGGSGAARTLDYAVDDLKGQTIQWYEHETRTIIGTTENARGTLRFTAAPGPAKRTIVATVLQGGLPRLEQPVATYDATARPLAAPAKVTVRRRGSRAVVRWTAVPGAAKYRVVADLSRGRDVVLTVAKPTATVKRAARRVTAKITVTPLDAAGTAGGSAVGRLRR